MTLNGQFTSNSVFMQMHLEFRYVDFENNWVKAVDPLSAVKMFSIVSGDIIFIRIFTGVLQTFMNIFVSPTYSLAHMSFWLFVRNPEKLY